MSNSAVKLRPVLGRWQLLAIGIGAIVGSGIFVIPGPAAAQFAGPGIVFSFAIAALGCALAGLCYAELSAMYPTAGSAFAFASVAFGRTVGWLIGWLLVLEYLFAAAIVAQAFASYFAELFGPALTSSAVMIRFVLPFSALAVAAYLAMRGVELSTGVVGALVVVKLGVIVLVILFGAMHIDPDHWQPFIPENSGTWGEYGWSGVLRAAGIVFYTYLGFDTVAIAAQEARRPQQDVPFALIGSLVICTLLFIPMMLVVTGMSDYRDLNVANPVIVAIHASGSDAPWLVRIVSLGATVGMFSVLVVIMMAQARLLFALAQDGLLPAPLAQLDARKGTPVLATVVTAVLAAVLCISLPIATLGQMVSIGVLAAFVAVAVAVLVWRRKYPEAPRPFRAPGLPFVPVAAILVCGYMAASLPPATWWRFGLWIVCGLVIYALYGSRSQRRAPPWQ